jgi:hypothetical protein
MQIGIDQSGCSLLAARRVFPQGELGFDGIRTCNSMAFPSLSTTKRSSLRSLKMPKGAPVQAAIGCQEMRWCTIRLVALACSHSLKGTLAFSLFFTSFFLSHLSSSS